MVRQGTYLMLSTGSNSPGTWHNVCAACGCLRLHDRPRHPSPASRHPPACPCPVTRREGRQGRWGCCCGQRTLGGGVCGLWGLPTLQRPLRPCRQELDRLLAKPTLATPKPVAATSPGGLGDCSRARPPVANLEALAGSMGAIWAISPVSGSLSKPGAPPSETPAWSCLARPSRHSSVSLSMPLPSSYTNSLCLRSQDKSAAKKPMLTIAP